LSYTQLVGIVRITAEEAMMRRQPIEVQTLYAELLEQLSALDAQRTIGSLPGTFVTKMIKGRPYLYFQHLAPGGAKRQLYIGRQDAALEAVVARFAIARDEAADDVAAARRIVALLRAGGALVTDSPSARVLRALADAGVFRQGGVLVGTHAFVVLGNVLGVAWEGGAIRTQDVDLAAAPRMSVAVTDEPADVPSALERLEMGFLPVPGLDRTSPSTAFKVRGQGLRVDLLTPARGDATSPVTIPRLKAAAQPLKFLGYLLESPVRAAVADGGGVLVNVPDPARFALHKLIVSGERPVTMAAKREKDLVQAAQVLEVLAEDRPGDIELAWDALAERGRGWVKRAQAGVSALRRVAPDVVDRLVELTSARP
jgi:hypothetical protein